MLAAVDVGNIIVYKWDILKVKCLKILNTSVYFLRFAESILRVHGLIESKIESVSNGKKVVLSSMYGVVADGSVKIIK